MDFNDLTYVDYQAIFANAPDNQAAEDFPFYPLNSPGMPEPGADFLRYAQGLGDTEPVVIEDGEVTAHGHYLKCLYLRALWSPLGTLWPVEVKGRIDMATMVPGHMWGDSAVGPRWPHETYTGPRVMVVGKMPGQDEVLEGRNQCGRSGTLLHDVLIKCGVPWDDLQWWYVNNLVRWPNLNAQGGALPQSWIKDCLPILHQEFRLWLPEYILCLGAEATKAICGGRNSVKSMAGRSITLQIPRHEPGQEPEYHEAQVMSVVHPAAVVRTTELLPGFETAIRQFVQLTRGEGIGLDVAYDISVVNDEETLARFVDEAIALPGVKKIAVDAEWHGDHPGEAGAYLRTIQFCYKDNHAVVVEFAHAGGAQAFDGGRENAVRQLVRLLDRDDVQIQGSFFSADLPWLEFYGVDIAHRFVVPADVNALNGGDYAGGFDVALAMHACDETGDLKLEMMCNRYCGMARWDSELREWLANYCAEHKLKADDVEGFGECPAAILNPYGGIDVIGTYKLAEVEQRTLLDSDRYDNSSWLPFHISMLAFPAFNEMHTVGLKVDYERIDAMTDEFMEVRDDKLAAFRADIRWPDFNPRSHFHCRDFLFGPLYSGKKDADGNNIAVGPADAERLYLEPVKTTGQRGKPWAQVMSHGAASLYTPSTDKEVLGILGHNNNKALALRDLRLIDQVLKSVFRPPDVVARARRNEVRAPDHPEVGAIVLDGQGRRVYSGGVGSYVCTDMRIRSWFLQTMETGRASSSRPPLQNLSNRREDDYSRIIGERHRYPVRSFITSNLDPDYQSNVSRVITEPAVLVEADYLGAELFSIAIMARSERMIEHCLRNMLPDDDPNHYDIHSNVAVRAFRLPCDPIKQALKDAGHAGKRVGAKNVIFGGNYGRSAEAIARQCKEEGTDIPVDEVQTMMNYLYQEEYPEIPELQRALRECVRSPGYIRTCMGRLRRFIPSDDKQVQGELERQALNFPFQSHVADAVSYALHHLYHHPRRAELGYRLVLQIHDAIVLEVPARNVDIVVHEILPECMVDKVPFYGCDTQGVPHPGSPLYRFGIDASVMTNWGIKLTWDECDSLGISREYGKAPQGVLV